MFRPAPRATTRRSRRCSITFRVLQPIEPVEPKMEMPFINGDAVGKVNIFGCCGTTIATNAQCHPIYETLHSTRKLSLHLGRHKNERLKRSRSKIERSKGGNMKKAFILSLMLGSAVVALPTLEANAATPNAV